MLNETQTVNHLAVFSVQKLTGLGFGDEGLDCV